MDRWTARDKEYLTYEQCKEQGTNGYYAREQELCRRLKRYEDAEEQGRLVVLPCKVGDKVRAKVYRPHNGHEATIYGEVVIIEILEKIVIRVKYDLSRIIDFYDTDFGKTVFLTREDAEKAKEVLQE